MYQNNLITVSLIENDRFKNVEKRETEFIENIEYDLNKYLSVFDYQYMDKKKDPIPIILIDTYNLYAKKFLDKPEEETLKKLLETSMYIKILSSQRNFIRKQRIENILLRELKDITLANTMYNFPYIPRENRTVTLIPEKILKRKEPPKETFYMNISFLGLEYFHLMYKEIKVEYKEFPVYAGLKLYENENINGNDLTAYYENGNILVFKVYSLKNPTKYESDELNKDLEKLMKILKNENEFDKVTAVNLSYITLTDRYAVIK